MSFYHDKQIDYLSHVHSGDHLLEDLLSGVDGSGVHFPVPLGDDVVQLSVVPERAPFSVHNDVSGLVFWAVPETDLKRVKT